MYYICKFYDSWIFCDASSEKSYGLEFKQIQLLKNLIQILIGDITPILLTIQINEIHPNKMLNFHKDKKFGYICKFTDSWVVYDIHKKGTRPLESPEIDLVKNLFPLLLNDLTKILIGIQIKNIQPGKFLKPVDVVNSEIPKKV